LFVLALLSMTACTQLGGSPRSNVDAFVQAAQVGDYATARKLSNDPPFIFGVWQGNTETALRAGHLETATIVLEEQRGATTAYCVEFHGTDAHFPTHSLRLFADEQGSISAVYPYAPGTCPQTGVATR
jgi:hypothetical protein